MNILYNIILRKQPRVPLIMLRMLSIVIGSAFCNKLPIFSLSTIQYLENKNNICNPHLFHIEATTRPIFTYVNLGILFLINQVFSIVNDGILFVVVCGNNNFICSQSRQRI